MFNVNNLITFIFIILIFILWNTISKKQKQIDDNFKTKKINKKPIIKKQKQNINYTNIYELAPYQATSLSPVNLEKMKYIVKQIENYPNKVTANPKWSCPWRNGYNNLLCFVDKHLNRKCIWTC